MKTPKIKCHLPWILNYQKKKKKSLDNHIKIALFSLLHALLRLPSSVSFLHLLKQIEKDSFQLIFLHSLRLHLTLFLPMPQSLFCPKKKKKKIQQTRDGMGFQERRMRMTTFSFQRTTFCFHNDLGRFLAICNKILWGRNWQQSGIRANIHCLGFVVCGDYVQWIMDLSSGEKDVRLVL